MNEYHIRITVKIPDNISREKIAEWAKYKTGYSNFLPADNPLIDTELEAISVSLETR